MHKAYTLLEISVVTAICLTMAAVSYPVLNRNIDRARFDAFDQQVLGHLVLARQVAQKTEASIRLDLEPGEGYAYRLLMQSESTWQEIARASFAPKGIGLKLPLTKLTHPTLGRTISQPLRSTHAPHVIFTGKGSSSGTLVFSDGKNEALCIVISGSTGRFRAYRFYNARWHSRH